VALIKGYASTLRRDDARWDKATISDSLAVIEEEADRLSKMIDDLLDASRLQAGGMILSRADVSLPILANRVAERFSTQSGNHTIVADFPKMIDDLLDASRLQAGGMILSRADVSLPILANRVAERFSTQSGNHTIVADFPAKFPVILADERRIEQVVSNLVSNALKYAPKGEIRITGSVRPEQVIVCVSDEGPGIEAKDLPHIFDRFYRSTKAVKHTKGAGLGLYLARAIVEAHGGHIWADPKPDSGARICFSLPR